MIEVFLGVLLYALGSVRPHCSAARWWSLWLEQGERQELEWVVAWLLYSEIIIASVTGLELWHHRMHRRWVR